MDQTDDQRKRPTFKQIQAGLWCRFSDYELSGGCIRPKAGARLVRHDPWQARSASKDPRKRKPAPYESLIRIVQSLRWKDPFGDDELDEKSLGQLLAWCREHGLLGVLLHVTHRVELAPRWRILKFDPQARCLKIGSGGLPGKSALPLRVVYSREPAGWCQEYMRIAREARPYDPDIEGRLVCGSDRKPLPGRVLVHDLPGDHPYLRWNQEKLSQTWAGYFPDVPETEKETYSYPLPGSDEFWKMYAEPLGEFLWGAGALATALKNLRAARRKRRPIEFSEATEHLNCLLAPISPRIGGPRPYRLEWQSPSLLGSFAMMALLELVAESARICLCAECSTIFVSQAYQSLYCSETCRHTAQKRRQRARRKIEAAAE